MVILVCKVNPLHCLCGLFFFHLTLVLTGLAFKVFNSVSIYTHKVL